MKSVFPSFKFGPALWVAKVAVCQFEPKPQADFQDICLTLETYHYNENKLTWFARQVVTWESKKLIWQGPSETSSPNAHLIHQLTTDVWVSVLWQNYSVFKLMRNNEGLWSQGIRPGLEGLPHGQVFPKLLNQLATLLYIHLVRKTQAPVDKSNLLSSAEQAAWI